MKTTSRNQYPEELKNAIARRYLASDISYRELADEVGADRSTVFTWVRNFREHGMAKKKRGKKQMTSDGRSAEEKLRLIMAAKGLDAEERGAFLRAEGVHDADLQRWEDMALGGLSGVKTSSDRRVRDLERRAAKQERRLREANALLELQKKVQALWEDEESDMEGSDA